MISDKLADVIQSYDDEALATLANAGLLRRAARDVGKGKAEYQRSQGDTAFVEIDGHLVEIGPDGPAKSACTCPAVGVCRHRLAAVLVLREASPGKEDQGEESSPDDDDPALWLDEISMDHARKFAGKPGWRAALELADEVATIEASGTRIAITFASLDEPALILKGQGIGGIVSKASKARQKAYHAAALLAARRHLGLEADTTEDESVGTVKAQGNEKISRPDESFLKEVRGALSDCAQLGFNLAPLPIEERLFELSVSSRADALPRLSSLLRSIAEQMRLRRGKSFEYDPDRMLEVSATAYAITFAVNRDSLEPREYFRLAGETRRSYVDAESFELVGCGADIWRATSGARGVTAHFVEPSSGEFFSVAIARGKGQDPDFIPRQAFKHQAVWNAGTMDELCHSRIILHNAGIADGGRLSSNRDVRAQVLEKEFIPDSDASYVRDSWAALQEDLVSRFALGIEATGQPQMALIKPAEVARPQFDEFAQRLIWPIRDSSGHWIALTMDYNEHTELAIAEIERKLARWWRGMMLVRASQFGAQVELTPVTLFEGKKSIDLTTIEPEIPWGAFGLSKPKKRPEVFPWLQSLRPDPGRALQIAPPSRSTAAVMEAWRHVRDRLEAGPKLARQLDGKRSAHAKRLEDYGMSALAKRVSDCVDGASHLAAAYALLVARHQRTSIAFLQ